MIRSGAYLVLLALGAGAQAATFTVTKNTNAGAGSLHDAILAANAAAGPDLILFSAGMSGKSISPTGPLPALTGPGTEIRGDIDGDGAPDVTLNGSGAPAGVTGLRVAAPDCTIRGLAIQSFPGDGIHAQFAPRTTIQSCHLGVARNGSTRAPNGEQGLHLEQSDDCLVGGSAPLRRNVIFRGSVIPTGVFIDASDGCRVWGNHVGVNRAGTAALGAGGFGIAVFGLGGPADGNQIGGTAEGRGNVIGGLEFGIQVFGNAEGNRVSGNLLGLGADGSTAIPIEILALEIAGGATNTTVGGYNAASRNVFGAATTGIEFADDNTIGNRVVGNYFGSNAAGTGQRTMETCIRLRNGAGRQFIGESGGGANHFTPQSPNTTIGIRLDGAGNDSVISHNRFGIRPNGTSATVANHAIWIDEATALVDGNQIARAGIGLLIAGSGNTVSAYNNLFRDNSEAVRVNSSALCRLGNLGNAATTDDGNNDFRTSNAIYIVNGTPGNIKAEGNDFHSTVRATIDAKILDKLDDPTAGRVDFNPLQGGVVPTGGADGALAVTGVAAVPLRAGTEIAFSLSTPARVTVEVLNLAGRSVAVPLWDRPTAAGLQRLVWTGLSRDGTAAPGGRYLVRVSASSPSGEQRSAVAAVTLAGR